MSKKMPEADDRALLNRILDREASALTELIELHAGRVRVGLQRQFPTCAVDEALNEAFFQVWHNIHEYDAEGQYTDRSIGALIFVTAKSRILDGLRKNREVSCSYLDDIPQDYLANRGGNQAGSDLVQALYTVLDDLSPLEKAVISNRLARDPLKLRELAEEYQTTLNSVKSANTRANNKIRGSLLALGYGSNG